MWQCKVVSFASFGRRPFAMTVITRGCEAALTLGLFSCTATTQHNTTVNNRSHA